MCLLGCAPSLTLSAEREPEDELETVVVTATRSGNLVRDEAIRVEVLPEEEIEENLTVQPGNLTTLLNELGGVRMQSTAPSMGGLTLQMRGLPGRHTLVLEDGLPLLGAQTDGFGLLQTPPLDLGRVELIKGVGSALYGGSALGGVLNLVSRRPDSEPEILLNRSSKGGSDLIGFGTGRLTDATGFTVIGGISDQSRRDDDHDGWSEQPSYRRYTLRPRLFHDSGDGTFFATLGFVDEERVGGSLPGRTLGDGSVFLDALETRRMDGGISFDRQIRETLWFNTRWSASRVTSTRRFAADLVGSVLSTGSAEASVGSHGDSQTWLAGLAVEFEKMASDAAPAGDYRHVVPAIFLQDEYSPVESLKLAASARADFHNRYGTFFSPRVSVLYRPWEDFSARLSAGTGFSAPTSRLDRIEATSLARLAPSPGLKAERARNASLDLKWQDDGWELNGSLFATRIRNPLVAREASSDFTRLQIANESSPFRVKGAELVVHRVAGVLHFIGSGTYLSASELDDRGIRRRADRIPKWTGELAALFESEERGRIGLELGYTGRQALEDNPYRTGGKSYVELGLLAEIRFGRLSVFFNADNLTNTRQSHFDPLLLPSARPDGERMVDLWAPVAGRVLNVGVRAEL